LPGHGASPAGAESYSVSGLGLQLERFVKIPGPARDRYGGKLARRPPRP
jgi:hypothetical protein